MKDHARSENRLRSVDIAKGLAIICIILGHLGVPSINRVVFTFHVPIFFLITGYFMDRKRSFPDFLINKIKTLIIPYVITGLVLVLIAVVMDFVRSGSSGALHSFKEWSYAAVYAAGDSYTEPFYIKGIGAVWFLWATFWGSVFLKLSLRFRPFSRLAFIMILFLAGYFSRMLFWFPLSIQAGACAALFLYFGHLFYESGKMIEGMSAECKIVCTLAALCMWIRFIWTFQSFWLVHCDIGRGIEDVIGALCGCGIFMLLCRWIGQKTGAAGRLLAYFGRYSLLVLCVHVIELDLLPWWELTSKVAAWHGWGKEMQIVLIISGKLVLDLTLAFFLSKILLIRRMFGYKS